MTPSADQILDDQTQTLEEALAKLEDRTTEVVEPTHIPEFSTPEVLDVAVECLKATVDLYHTISKEGVSLADVQALRAIQDKMRPYARLPIKPALEAYEGMFTPGRSMINQTISQEASLAEAGKTLKEWFFIFVDFIIRVSDWCRRVWNSEDMIRGRLKMMDTYLMSLWNQLKELKLYNETLGRKSDAELAAIAEKTLKDPKLVKSRTTLVAFAVSNNAKAIEQTSKMVDRNFDRLMKDILSMRSHIEANKPMALGGWWGMEINDLAILLEALTVADVDEKDFINTIGTDFWERPRQLVSRPILAASHNIEQVQRMAKEIRGIKRNGNWDDLKEIDIVVQSVENLSEGTKGLERIIKFKQGLYVDYYKASATYANFYIAARDFLADEIKTKSAADFDNLVMDRLNKAWETTLDKMGI